MAATAHQKNWAKLGGCVDIDTVNKQTITQYWGKLCFQCVQSAFDAIPYTKLLGLMCSLFFSYIIMYLPAFFFQTAHQVSVSKLMSGFHFTCPSGTNCPKHLMSTGSLFLVPGWNSTTWTFHFYWKKYCFVNQFSKKMWADVHFLNHQ